MSHIPFKWDIFSMILYIVLGLIAVLMLFLSKKRELSKEKWLFKDKYLTFWFLIWLIIAVFRLVDLPIGGTDATNYIEYFQICRNNNIPVYFEHFAGDVIFKFLNQSIRLLTSDYHLYFIVIYGLMCYAFIEFCHYFCPNKTSFVPFVLTFFLFLRGFTSIRSHLSIVVILIACILLAKGKNKAAVIVALSAALVHKAALLYAMCILFCLFFLKRKITIKVMIVLLVIAILTSTVLQQYFILFTMDMDLSGSYASYASRSLETNFWENAWKLAFEQMFLGIFVLIYHKKLISYVNSQDCIWQRRINIIYLICIFDLLLIPVNYTLSIWRGYEYFYLPRLVMWGILLYLITKNYSVKYRPLLSFTILSCFVAWMVFRVWSTWESSGLMPYVFAPFQYL